MNQELAKRFWPVMKAFAEGATVQHRIVNRAAEPWKDCENPIFNDPRDEYRIKPPTPQFRPWTASEFPHNCVLKHNKGEMIYRPCSWDERGATIIYKPTGEGYNIERSHISFDEMFNYYKFSTDGGKAFKPCGVQISDEAIPSRHIEEVV